MEYVLQTTGLTKKFKSTLAVDHVDMNIKKGDIYGFIGKNGAGKTTLIRLIAGLASSNQGEINLFGHDELNEARGKVGTMIENPAVFPKMTARGNLRYYCVLLGLDPDDNIDYMLDLVGLNDAGKKKAKDFSLGMKQRLAIAIVLLGEPELLLLDEPINGLDPTGIKEFRDLILWLNKEKNITILISSHILGELSKIANRYGVINNGILIDEFTKEELLERCVGELQIKVDNIDKAKEVLSNSKDFSNYKIIDEHTIHLPNVPENAGQVNKELVNNDVSVMSSSVVGQDLEGYFMSLMEANESQIR